MQVVKKGGSLKMEAVHSFETTVKLRSVIAKKAII
jgi:hypothetical protein